MSSSKMVTYNVKQHEAIIHRNYKSLSATMKVENGKVVYQMGIGTEADRCSFILAFHLKFDGIDEVDVRQKLIRKAALEAVMSGNRDFKAFCDKLTIEINNYFGRSKQNFSVVLPLGISALHLRRGCKFNILDTTFVASDWYQLSSKFAVDDWFKDVGWFNGMGTQNLSSDLFDLQTNFVPLVSSFMTHDPHQAFSKAQDAFQLLLGAMVLIKSHGREHIQFGGLPRPMSNILPAPIFGVFFEDGKFESGRFNMNIPHFGRSSVGTGTLSASELKSLRRLLRDLTHTSDPLETMSLLISSVKKYGFAHQVSSRRDAFLELWQILELLTYPTSEPRFNMNDVGRRVRIFLEPDQRSIDLMNIATDIRNDLVHKGEFTEADQPAVNSLKSIVDQCIISILGLRKRYPKWRDLEIFYQYASRNDNDLKEHERVIQHIQQLRRGRETRKLRQGERTMQSDVEQLML